MAMAVTLMVVILLLAITGASLSLSRLELKKTSNHKLGTLALEIADTALQHAVVEIGNGAYFEFPTQGNSGNVFNNTQSAFLSGFTYKVTGVNVGVGEFAWLTATAMHDASGTKRSILAYAQRGTYGMGTVHLGGDTNTIQTNFSGEAFSISGTDRCGLAPEVAAISITDPDLKDDMINGTNGNTGLSDAQQALITGLGDDDPSILAIGGSDTLVGDLADAFLAEPNVVTVPGGNFTGNQQLGTQANPQTYHITGDATVTGNVTGYGVIIIDGSVNIQGNLNFEGIIIARGEVAVTVLGNAEIYGSLMLEETNNQDAAIELDIRGNATLQYDSCALATTLNGTGINNPWVPINRDVKILGWKEIM